MNNLEKKLKERLNGLEVQDKNINKDALWANIEKKLAPEGTVLAPVSQANTRLLWKSILALSGVAILVIATFIILNYGSSGSSSSTRSTLDTPSNVNITSDITKPKNISSSENDINTNDRNAANDEIQNDNDKANNENLQNLGFIPTSEFYNKNKTNVSDNTLSSDAITSTNPLTESVSFFNNENNNGSLSNEGNTVPYHNPALGKDLDTPSSPSNEETSLRSNYPLSSSNSPDNSNQSSSLTNLANPSPSTELPIRKTVQTPSPINSTDTPKSIASILELPSIANETSPITLPKSISNFELGVAVGVHTISTSFEDATLDNTHSLELGYQLGIQAKYQTSTPIYIKSGILYRLSKEEFNYTQTWDTLVAPNNIVGEPLIPAEATRVIRHHNTFKQISVPILIGVNKKSSLLEYGIAVGAGIDFTIAQEGKLLDSSAQIISYPSNETDFSPRKKVSISYQIEPQIAYRISPSLTANAYASLQYAPNIGSVQVSNQTTINLGIGLMYRF